MIETEIQDRIQGLSYLVYNLAVLTDTQIKQLKQNTFIPLSSSLGVHICSHNYQGPRFLVFCYFAVLMVQLHVTQDSCSSCQHPTNILVSKKKGQRKPVQGKRLPCEGMILQFTTSLLLSSYCLELGPMAIQLEGNLGNIVFILGSYVSLKYFFSQGKREEWILEE